MLLLRAPSSIVTHIPGRDWDENLWCRYIGNVNVIRVPLYVRGVSPLIYSFITRGDIRVRPVLHYPVRFALSDLGPRLGDSGSRSRIPAHNMRYTRRTLSWIVCRNGGAHACDTHVCPQRSSSSSISHPTYTCGFKWTSLLFCAPCRILNER